MPSLSIWCNRQFDAPQSREFELAIAPHRVVWAGSSSASNLVSAPSDPALVDTCDIAYGQPAPRDVADSSKLKLICLSSAGYTRYDNIDFRTVCKNKGIAVCNASGVYDEPCAQHALAMMLGSIRQLPGAMASQISSRGWPYLPLRSKSGLLDASSTVLLVGYGAIAKRLAGLLGPFGARVTAFRRTPRGDEVVETRRIDELDTSLGSADHVVNILPASPETAGFFHAARFARFKPGSRFYNLGRGDTVDQSALIDALKSGRLASAYLDVTSPEPLPPDHPLWIAPNCFITPHTAGGTYDEAERQIRHFAENLRRFTTGSELIDRIF